MDCQTCNDLLLDLAYGELDEVRAAAARKHLDGCGECGSAFARINRGRSLAKRLAPEEPPAVSMTLRAAIEAQAARFGEAAVAGASGGPVPDDGVRESNVIALSGREGRVSRWFERIGELAMRRQVAMAAVFMLMIGVGLIFYQSHPRPADTQDDRVPDVVPAVEVTASPSNNQAEPTTPRIPTPGASHEERQQRAYQTPTVAPVAANVRADSPAARDRRAGGSAGNTGSGLEANGADLDSLLGSTQGLGSGGTGGSMAGSYHAPSHAATQSAQGGRQAMAGGSANTTPMPSPATAPAPPPTVAQAAPMDTLVRLQNELASTTDPAAQSRIREQMIAEYTRRGMSAEANALRAQAAEPNAAISNSLNNSAAASVAELSQSAASPAAAAPSSSVRAGTRRAASVHRASPSRSMPADSYMDNGL